MKIFINGKEAEVNTDISIENLLRSKNLNHDKGLAVAVNEKIVSKENWEYIKLKENDEVLIFSAIQGG